MAYCNDIVPAFPPASQLMEVIHVIDGASVVRLPDGQTVMVGAPPEALKVLLLWGWPTPQTVVLAPDPLYAHGINQASFEFLLYNFLFRERPQRAGPFTLVCDEAQRTRVEMLVREILHGPDDAQMAAWDTPEAVRDHLLRETAAVSGPISQVPCDKLVRIVTLRKGRAALGSGVEVRDLPPDDCEIVACGEAVRVAGPAGRGSLPFFFPEPDRPAQPARFGIQVIGSGSGFSPCDWSSCFVVWINGLPLVVDGTPYLDEHLERLGIPEDQVIGYLITHNHEDHANAIGQFVNRRRVTVLTAPPVMAGLATRLSAILGLPEDEVRRMVDFVPLEPGFENAGPPQSWYGAEIRAWYSVHTVPTIGIEISLGRRRIRLPGDTLWGRQLQPFREDGTITPAREEFIQSTYGGADVVIADAGGGPVHPDPGEVSAFQGECSHRLLVTHAPTHDPSALENVRSGAVFALEPAPAIDPPDLLAAAVSPLLRSLSETWPYALMNAGEVLSPEPGESLAGIGPFLLLRGRARLAAEAMPEYHLHRGDLFSVDLLPVALESLTASAEWTRLLRIPEPAYRHLLRQAGLERRLRRLYETRAYWTSAADADLPLETLLKLSEMGRRRRFRSGSIILQEGDAARHFYVLVSGHVEVLQGNRRFGAFSRGYGFGEIGLLNEAPRSASVRAVDDVTVLELPERAFRECLLNIPLAHFRLARARDLRLAELAS